MTTAPALPTPTLTRASGCDRCGVDDLGRPLRAADVELVTPTGGRVALCNSCIQPRQDAFLASGGVLVPLPPTPA